MLVIRLLAVITLLGIAASLLAWIFTGNLRYKSLAWNFFRAALVTLFVFLGLLALERVLIPFV